MAMSFTPLGVGDAFSARFYSTCLAVEADGKRLLIDCPHPIRKILRESSSLDIGDFDAVVVTHLHADHASGLEGLGYFSWFVLRRKFPLVAHPRVMERLWEGHLAAGMECLIDREHQPHAMGFDDYFAWLPVDDRVEVGPFQIEVRRTIHHIPTTALRITAGGRTLAYSADTAFDPSLIAWLASADHVVHETNLGVHTPYASLAALPAGLRAKMSLIHYPDDFDAAHSVIAVCEQGRRYEV
jgi:ribonuclease BN (tRNA processing enzyme)